MYLTYKIETGDIVQYSSHYDERSIPLDAAVGNAVIEVEERASQYAWVKYGAVVEPEPKPSDFHVWNPLDRVWDYPLQPLVDAALERIEQGRLIQNYAIIEYDGSMLDGDLKSQKNISDKITELNEATLLGIETPAETLLWRDANNVMHYFETVAAYRAWLGGLAVALAQRGTMAYVWAWQQKALLQQAVSVLDKDAILALPNMPS
jgi:hypothetical protein